MDANESVPAPPAAPDEDSFNLTCDVCNRTFANPFSLRRHHMTHSGAKPFVCEICNWAFSEACKLKKHMKKIHDMDNSIGIN
jgi:uncharacterized Zn-finger protein